MAGYVNSNELTSALLSRGAALVGFADLSALPRDVRMDLPSGVSIAVAVKPGIIAGIADGPTIEYYAEDRRIRDFLDSLGTFAAGYLAKRGHRALAMTEANIRIDRETSSTRLPHKTVATRAGLGWIGKTAMLVTRQYGLAVSLTTVLTDAELPVARPIDAAQCGDCRVCVDVCPDHAATGLSWQKDIARSTFFDASVCRSTGIRLAAMIGIHDNCCGMCVAACPRTQAYIRRGG